MRKTQKNKSKPNRNRGTQQLRDLGVSNQEQTPTGVAKTSRPEGSQTPGRHRNSRAPGTYNEALANISAAIFTENYPEDKLAKDEQDLIFKQLGRMFGGTLNENGNIQDPSGWNEEHSRGVCVWARARVRSPTVWSTAYSGQWQSGAGVRDRTEVYRCQEPRKARQGGSRDEG
jgi:hypothetical protein